MSENQNPIAVAALTRKRTEIAKLVVALEQRIAECREDLVHIDNALRLITTPLPDELLPVRQRYTRNKGYFVHGELSRRIYEAFRTHETVSAAEVAAIALADKGIEDGRVRATFVARFLVRFHQLATNGTVERIGSGQGVRWRLTEAAN